MSAFLKFSGRKALLSVLAVAGLGFYTLSVAAGHNPLRTFGVLPNGPEHRSDLTRDQGYRVEVAVQTPNGIRSGYSVVHVYGWDRQTLQGSWSTGVFRGEAVAIDLDDGRTLYMTFASPKSGDYGIKIPWTSYAKSSHDSSGRVVLDIPQESWPLMGFFRDQSVPSSIVEVTPGKEEESLGEGFEILSLKVIETDEEPTQGILKRLPWAEETKTHLNGKRFSDSDRIEAVAGGWSFRQGF